jgi:hypothetical protein
VVCQRADHVNESQRGRAGRLALQRDHAKVGHAAGELGRDARQKPAPRILVHKPGRLQRQQAGSPDEGTGIKLYAYDIEPYLPGDVDGDGQLTCFDVSAVMASIGKRAGEPGFLPKADLDQYGVVDMRDVVAISRLLPSGMRCK